MAVLGAAALVTGIVSPATGRRAVTAEPAAPLDPADATADPPRARRPRARGGGVDRVSVGNSQETWLVEARSCRREPRGVRPPPQRARGRARLDATARTSIATSRPSRAAACPSPPSRDGHAGRSLRPHGTTAGRTSGPPSTRRAAPCSVASSAEWLARLHAVTPRAGLSSRPPPPRGDARADPPPTGAYYRSQRPRPCRCSAPCSRGRSTMVRDDGVAPVRSCGVTPGRTTPRGRRPHQRDPRLGADPCRAPARGPRCSRLELSRSLDADDVVAGYEEVAGPVDRQRSTTSPRSPASRGR